jgi:hypothetical protein
MFGQQQSNKNDSKEALEQLHYSRYYEHDGKLRAYSNRAMIFAVISSISTLVAVSFAMHVRMQPPTVIRVDGNGNASVLGQSKPFVSVTQGQEAEPNDFEKAAFVRQFLERYLNFTAGNVTRNWKEALNMTTSNLRSSMLKQMTDDNTVGKIQGEQMRSDFKLRGPIEVTPDNPLTLRTFGVKEVHRVREHGEGIDRIVSEFRVRLVVERRSEINPTGLLVAEFSEQPIEGEKRDRLLELQTESTDGN